MNNNTAHMHSTDDSKALLYPSVPLFPLTVITHEWRQHESRPATPRSCLQTPDTPGLLEQWGAPGPSPWKFCVFVSTSPVLCAHELISAFSASMPLRLPKPVSGTQMCSLWLTWCFKKLLSQHLQFGLFHLKHVVSSFS